MKDKSQVWRSRLYGSASSKEVRKFIIHQLPLSLSEEWPSFDGLETLLIFHALESVFVKACVGLWGHTGILFNGALPGPLHGELFCSQFYVAS